MDKVKAIKELEHFSSLLIEGEELEVPNIYTIRFSYNSEFFSAIKEAVEALKDTEKIGKCEGCISFECEFCTRYNNRHDMYQDRWLK